MTKFTCPDCKQEKTDGYLVSMVAEQKFVCEPCLEKCPCFWGGTCATEGNHGLYPKYARQQK